MKECLCKICVDCPNDTETKEIVYGSPGMIELVTSSSTICQKCTELNIFDELGIIDTLIEEEMIEQVNAKNSPHLPGEVPKR